MSSLGFLEDYVRTAGSSRQTLQTFQVSCLPDQFLYQHLKNGAAVDMNVDGSSSVVKFKYTCPANKMVLLNRVMFHMVDGTIDPADFGGISGALTNGLLFKVYNSSDVAILDFLGGGALTDNGRMSHIAGSDVVIHYGAGAAEDSLLIRFTISKAGAIMILNPGDYIQIDVRDDLTPLTQFHVIIQGLIIHAE